MYQYIQYEEQGGRATITMNRPEVYNALNQGIKEELLQAFKAAENNPEIRVVVLAGAGNAFCSGQDLKSAQEEMKGKSYADAIRTYYNPLILQMRHMPKPIIARIQGIAAGAGCSLALACDVVVASEDAILSELFVGIGLVMDSGSTYFLPRMIGRLKAFELASLGTQVQSAVALELGLVNKVVSEESLDKAVQTYVEGYLNAPSTTVGLIKQMLHQSANMSLEEVLELEAEYQDKAAVTQDHQEGMKAFLEKRDPKFTGK
ncbi:2-(1,2-epoxy-1,2-dihydrophenyl)acetyl-CoA isomerase [Catalinimonas alkaloidigena]|uniref:enoyl-CoA hydratase/isomerase family protein n=1 Tax=Catalinimonas alkaloidigena TaxID=1075417 RepID=UPI002407254E|nr:enoyl-CoA hydratase-related protein [Catalinimonas alkaloidigena]MDF9795394.1 2-(1,2-epoxy-1,2-dihydrophenyl)acetyl-CoA isomerase [Catalinimonas alkaloidigena]